MCLVALQRFPYPARSWGPLGPRTARIAQNCPKRPQDGPERFRAPRAAQNSPERPQAAQSGLERMASGLEQPRAAQSMALRPRVSLPPRRNVVPAMTFCTARKRGAVWPLRSLTFVRRLSTSGPVMVRDHRWILSTSAGIKCGAIGKWHDSKQAVI